MNRNIIIKGAIFLIMFILILLAPNIVFGVSFSGKIEASTNKIKAGEEIEFKFYLQDYEDIEDGLNAYKATLDYDSNIFENVELEDFKSQNQWQEFLYNENTHEFIAIKKAGSKNSEEVVTLKLRAKNDIKSGETTIKIKDIVASEGKEDIKANDVEAKIAIISSEYGNSSNNNSESNKQNGSIYDDEKPSRLPQTGEGSITAFILIAIEVLIVFAIFVKCKEKGITKKMKKSTRLFVTILCFGVISVQLATNIYAAAIKGELNDDGKIDYKDVTLLEQHLIHLKELDEDKKNVADMNNDGKLTVTDLSLLVKKIESSMDYEVTIISNLDSYYAKKNEEIEFKFTADVSNNAGIKAVVVNGAEYTTQKSNENSSEYIIKINAQDKAGIQELKFSKAILDVGKEVKLNYTEKIEVLKDMPSIDNYTLEESIEEGKLIAKFEINDNDKAVTSATIKIYNANNEEIKTENISVGVNTIEILAKENDKYTLSIYVSYNLDTDSLEGHEEDNTGTLNLNKDLEFIGDYEFSISNIQTYNKKGDKTNSFEKDEAIILNFDSKNVTKAIPSTIKINGEEYDVIEKDGRYSAEISGISEEGNKVLNIEEVTLSNGKKIEITNTMINITINKKSPSIDNVKFNENIDTSKLQLSFNVKDEDNTISNIKYVVTSNSGDVIAEKIITGNNEINDEIDLTNNLYKSYTVKIIATYNNAGEDVRDKVLYTNTIEAKDRVIIKDGEASKTQIEKNEEITLTYTIETNKEENIEKIVVNNIEADVTKKDGKYSVTISDINMAGMQNITVTEVIFEDNVEVEAIYTNTVEVLKDKPVVNNFKVAYNYAEKKVNFTFELEDIDSSIVSAMAILVKQDGSTWKENDINVNQNNFDLEVEDNIEYTFKILVTYSRYADCQNIVTDEVIFTKPIQMIEEYNLEISNIKTFTNENIESKYFEKDEKIILFFESTNSSNYYIEKAVINGKEYVMQNKDNYYATYIDAFNSSGVKEIQIEKVYLNNSKELDVNKDNTTKIEILKSKPTVEKFEYTQTDNQSITLSFEIIDAENTLQSLKLIVTDENGYNLATKENLDVGENEITFNTTESEKYLIKIIADYDLDTNELSVGDNEYNNQEILNEEITISQELIEFKDIESIKLYKEENNNVIEEIEVNVLDFKPEDYIVEVTMKDLPKFYAEIKDTKIEDGKFMLILDYDNTVQYDGDKKSNNLEVKFGEINENNIASNLSFEELIKRINEDPTGEFELTQDLDANVLNITGSTVITTDFKGKLNGNGYTIKNLSKPLFNNLSGAEITNLIIDDANVSGSNKGILSNYATNSTISNVHITNSRINTSHENGTGGFIGKIENKSLIEKSSATNIKVSGGKRVGGFVGYLNGGSTIDNCYITGIVGGSNDAIGGISGQDSGTSKIQNCYANIEYNVVNNWSNGGIAGYSDSNSLILKNNISLADGKVGARIIGTGYNSSSSNNYEMSESNLSSNANGNRINQISKNDLNQEFFEEELGWDSTIWRFDSASYDNLPTLKNNDPKDIENKQEEVADEDTYIPDINRLQNMSNYEQNKEIAYSNIYKLMPYYDAKYIVYYGNKIEEDNLLNQSKIKMIIPYDKNGKMIVGLNTNNYNDIAKIRIVFENEQTADYTMTFDKKLNDVAVYDIKDLGIKYNFNQLILNTDISTLQTIINKAKELDYKSQISSVTTETESRLYTDYYNESVQGKLDEVILEILENIPEYNLYLDNDILKTKIEQELLSDSNLEKILYTYNYFDKWYHMEIGGIPLTDIIFTKVNDVNEDYSILNLTQSTMGQSENTRKTSNTVTFFNNVIKPELNDKGIGVFLEYFMKILEGYDNGNDWFADHFEGILNEKPAVGKEDTIRYRAWELLKAKNYLLLPILSAPQEDMYIVSVPSQLVIGSMNIYGQYNSGDIEGMKKTIDDYATKIGNFYGISATFINNSEAILNSHAHVQYDTRFNFPTGDQNPGTTQDPVIKWVYEAVGSFAAQNGSGAYADGSNVYWVAYHVLGSDFSFQVFTHETAHNQDGYYFYEGYGRRGGTGAEDHADSNIAQDLGDGSLVFNIMRDKAVTEDDSNNLTMARITGAENIYTYYKEMFETYYVLDYLTAQAFLQLTPEEQARVAVQVTYQGGTDYEKGGSTTIYKQITADEFRKMNLQNMEDLWNNGIALRGTGTVTGAVPGSYGGDNHYSIYWYQPHNNSGRPDSYSFKRLGFEMLGVAGYSNGYVTYRSGKSSNDLDALRKVTGDNSITWKEYKLNRYAEVEKNLNQIPYFDTNLVIEAYKEALEKDAVNGNRNNTNNLRRILYGIVKRATKDFTTGTIYSINEEVQISSAEQFIEVLKNATWGNYVITKDLDFSNISTTESAYVNKTFVGRINGNGHKITGLTKPLFSEVVYGEIQNLTIDEPKYSENDGAILTIKSKQLLLDNVVANNVNINLPFVKTNQGSIQWLGATAINVKENEINSVEDLINVSADNLNRKKKYKLNADIDVSSITGKSAIITGEFLGSLDGNNHNIYNLNMPLFESLKGTVKNLSIENMNFNSSGTSTIGALASTANNATVENIKVNNVTINGRENLAGLVGIATNSTFNKISVDNINITGPRFYIGGIIGRSTNVTLSNARVTGKMSIQATHNGGVIGAMNSGAMENIYSNVEIKRPSNTDTRNQNGGLIGSIESGNPTVRNCIAVGNVANDVYKAIGGINGKTAGELIDKKNYISKVYENSEATGITNTNEDSNIQSVDSAIFKTKEFYTVTLGWSEEIWNFSDMEDGPDLQ